MKRGLYVTEDQIVSLIEEFDEDFIDTIAFKSSLIKEMEEVVIKKLEEIHDHVLTSAISFFEWINRIKPDDNKDILFSFWDTGREMFTVNPYSVDCEEETNLDEDFISHTMKIFPIVVEYILIFLKEKGVYCYSGSLIM